MWKILQKDILQGVDEFDASVSDWTSLPMDIASVASLNNKLQKLVSGAKLNKAGHFSELIKSVQAFLEGESGKLQTLDLNAQQRLKKVGETMRELATSDSPADHYQNCLSSYQNLSQEFQPDEQESAVESAHELPVSSIPSKIVNEEVDKSKQKLALEAGGQQEPVSIVAIFLQEVEAKTHELIDGLLKVEKGVAGLKDYEEMMRNAHSLKVSSSVWFRPNCHTDA